MAFVEWQRTEGAPRFGVLDLAGIWQEQKNAESDAAIPWYIYSTYIPRHGTHTSTRTRTISIAKKSSNGCVGVDEDEHEPYQVHRNGLVSSAG